MFCFVDFPGRSYWIVLCNIFAPHCQSMKKEAFIEVCVGSPVGVAYRDGWGVTAGTGISGAVLLPLASLPLTCPNSGIGLLNKRKDSFSLEQNPEPARYPHYTFPLPGFGIFPPHEPHLCALTPIESLCPTYICLCAVAVDGGRVRRRGCHQSRSCVGWTHVDGERAKDQERVISANQIQLIVRSGMSQQSYSDFNRGRAAVNLGCKQEDWEHLEQTWEEYNRVCRCHGGLPQPAEERIHQFSKDGQHVRPRSSCLFVCWCQSIHTVKVAGIGKTRWLTGQNQDFMGSTGSTWANQTVLPSIAAMVLWICWSI